MESSVNAANLTNEVQCSPSPQSSGKQMLEAFRSRKLTEDHVKRIKNRIHSLERALETTDRQAARKKVCTAQHQSTRLKHQQFVNYLDEKKTEHHNDLTSRKAAIQVARKSLQLSLANAKESTLKLKKESRDQVKANSQWSKQFIEAATAEANQWRRCQVQAARQQHDLQSTSRIQQCRSQCSLRSTSYHSQIQDELNAAQANKRQLEKLLRQEKQLLELLQQKSPALHSKFLKRS